jgi:glutathione peroxidase
MMAKVDVNGAKEAPLWKALKDAKGSMLGRDIKWNFAKFLIARDGTVIERYLPTTSPSSIAADIDKLLGASA